MIAYTLRGVYMNASFLLLDYIAVQIRMNYASHPYFMRNSLVIRSRMQQGRIPTISPNLPVIHP